MQTPEWKGGENPRGERARIEYESQMSEEPVEGRNFLKMQILHWSGISNVWISFRDFVMWLKKEPFSSKKHKTYNHPLHIFQKDAAKLTYIWEKRQAFIHPNEVNSEQMYGTSAPLTTVFFFHSRKQKDPFF